MTALSDYAENALFNHLYRNVAMTSPTTVYLALFTTDPTDANTGTEVSGGSYARQAVTFSAPSNGVGSNTADIVFPVATANWGTVGYVAIMDAATAGNQLSHGALTTAQAVNNGNQFIISAGQLQASLA